jgi:dienelactone hydrolase
MRHLTATTCLSLAVLLGSAGCTLHSGQKSVIASNVTADDTKSNLEASPYKSDFYYPGGDGPFPVIILSHGRGGPHSSYHKIAEAMVRNGRAAIVLDHYSARGEYGVKFGNFPNFSESKNWREHDIQDLLSALKKHPRINRKEVVLAGWSAGAGIVLPIISNPSTIDLAKDISIAGAILTYPATYGCYNKIQSFNVPVIIHFGKLDGNNGNPLTGYHCWKDKVGKFKDSKYPVIFKSYDDAYHGYDLVILRNRPKRCRNIKYRDGIGQMCMAFNESSFKQTTIENKKFLRKVLGN